MCVIIVAAPHASISRDILDKCNAMNSQGIGIAYLANGRVSWDKGINLTDAENILRGAKDYWRAIHFRLATVGKECKQLCHPFPITGSLDLQGTGTCLMHNGHFNHDGFMVAGRLHLDGPVSDSRVASALCNRLRYKQQCRLLQAIGGHWLLATPRQFTMIGKYEKIATQSENGLYFSNLTWQHYANYVFCDDVQYSPDARNSHLSKASYPIPSNSDDASEWKDYWERKYRKENSEVMGCFE